jgi:ATP-dependent Clp protease ATP-binding subunit ClpC
VFERFTDRARKVLTLAQDEARLLHHSFIGTEHILLGLLREGDGMGAEALRSLGISLDVVRGKVVDVIGMTAAGVGGSPPFTPRAKKVLELALREALIRNQSDIGTEHILLGLVREGQGVAYRVLVDCGAEASNVRQAVENLMTDGAAASPEIGLAREQPEVAEPVPMAREPACPACGALLSHGAHLRSLRVPHDDPALEPRSLTVVYCTRCGTTLQMFGQDGAG